MRNRKASAPKEPADVESVLAEFDRRRDGLSELCVKTKGLIEACLEDAGIPCQSVQFRVKKRNKLREKYADPTKGYKKLDDITDLAGLRVITYYEDDVDRVAEVIIAEFQVDPENSVDKRETEPERFGYYALNYVCRHSSRRAADVEYKRFSGIPFEVQITSILRHAWAEIQHDWYDMKAAFPDDIKRRFARMAALLEIAESEFLDLRKKKSNYQQSLAVQVEANVPDIPLDQASLLAFVIKDPVVLRLDRAVAAYVSAPLSNMILEPRFAKSAAEMLVLVGVKTIKALRGALAAYGDGIVEFLRESGTLGPGGHPFGKIWIGESVYHLAFMLLGQRGEEEIISFMWGGDFHAPKEVRDEVSRVVAASSQVLAKFPRPEEADVENAEGRGSS